ncbi:caspase-7, partial [Octopus bimaculoides]
MDYTDAQSVEGIFFKERNPDSQLEDVKMTSVENSTESVNTRYNMDRNKKNLALIIDNESFDESTKMSKRQGSHRDASAIENTLKTLRFNVINRKNLSVKSMKQIFTDISAMDHGNYNCF